MTKTPALGSLAALLIIGLLAEGVVAAQTSSLPDALVTALRRGGLVIVMRHATSPRETPSKATANSDNATLERQLDQAGRAGARNMGVALRDLQIPIGSVLTSPTYRARETARLAQLGPAQSFEELGDGGQSMQGVTEAQAAWLRTQSGKAPSTGNAVIITHQPNIARAFPSVSDVADGECLVFRPDGSGGARLVGRIKIDDWPRLRR